MVSKVLMEFKVSKEIQGYRAIKGGRGQLVIEV